MIREAASQRRFLGYKELADGSGLEWSKEHYALNTHLSDLIEWASAIVVNQKNIETGSMEPATLLGFANAARGLGYEFTDDAAFLREQQQMVFAWAATELK